MKKHIALFLILTFLCSLACACTTYKTTEAVAQAFQEHKEAFASAVDSFKELGFEGNYGYVHTLGTDRLATFCADSKTCLVETEGLHVHSEIELTEEQVNTAVTAAKKLMQEIKINIISFCDEYIRFTLYDKNPYSWDPILACWLKGTPDALKIGYGEDVVHVEGNWYACIMDR